MRALAGRQGITAEFFPGRGGSTVPAVGHRLLRLKGRTSLTANAGCARVDRRGRAANLNSHIRVVSLTSRLTGLAKRCEDLLAERGRAHGPSALSTFEQGSADVTLQAVDLDDERRLRDAETFSGLA
jgi:hypothetical protein